MALLVEPAPADAAGRDEAAMQALRCVAGDDALLVSRRASGRPRLSPPYCELGIAISTCRDALLVGFHRHHRVGVDLEAESALGVDEIERIAHDHFAPHEAAGIIAAPRSDQRALFLCLWTAKEAALKVTGRGVYDGLRWPPVDIIDPPPGFDPVHVEVPPSRDAGAMRIGVRRVVLASAGTAWAALCIERGA